MRFGLFFELENEIFPIQYHESMVSFIKFSLSQYDDDIFNNLYNARDNTIKPFTFAVFFSDSIISSEHVFVKDKKLNLNISLEDINLAIVLYNAMNNQMNKCFPLCKNSMRLVNISLLPINKIIEDRVTVKFLSPLIVRERDQKNRKDYYHSFNSDKFNDIIRINIKEQLKNTNFDLDLVNELNIRALKPKKIVVKLYEKQIECSLGIYELIGNREILNYLYLSGMGSKHSLGFGMFKII